MTRDDDILISPCHAAGGMVPVTYLSVDDFHDPDEGQITAAEIHVTVVSWDGRREAVGHSFRLSVASARELARQLKSAVRLCEPRGGAG